MAIVSPRFVLKLMLSCIVLLAIIHCVVYWCWGVPECAEGFPVLFNYGFLFDLNQEQNIPTWYSILQICILTVLFSIGAISERKRGASSIPWWGLVFIFLYIGMDEMTDLHGFWAPEGVDKTDLSFSHEGFNWVYGGALVVLLIGIAYLRWLVMIEKRLRVQTILAGVLFVSGALIFEIVGALVVDETFLNGPYILASTMEETLEMIGIAVMIHALLAYFQRTSTEVRFGVGPGPEGHA